MLAHECARQLQWLRRTCSQGLPALRREPCSHVGHWWVRYGCHRCFGAHFRYHSCLQDTSKMTRVSLGTKQFQQVFWRMYRSMPEVSRVGHCVHATGALEHDADVIGVLGHRMGVTYVWKRCSSARIKCLVAIQGYRGCISAMYWLCMCWLGIGRVLAGYYWLRIDTVLNMYWKCIWCSLTVFWICIICVLAEYWLSIGWSLSEYWKDISTLLCMNWQTVRTECCWPIICPLVANWLCVSCVLAVYWPHIGCVFGIS